MCKKFNLLLVLVIVVLTLQSTALAADPNMIAIYWMDAGEGNTVWDYSGNGRNGTINGAVSWSGAGRIGGCLEFSGGIVEIRDNVEDLQFGDKDVTITAWIKTGAINQCFFSKVTTSGVGHNYALGVGQNGADNLAALTNRNRANIKSTTDVNDNEWHHIALVQDRDDSDFSELWSMYVDGVMESRLRTDVDADTGEGGMYIGQAEEYLSNNWSGFVDELYIYGSVLDDADMPFVMDGATWKPRSRDLIPVDGSVITGTSVELSWSAGWADTALGEHLAPDAHRVYLSTDVNAVTEARDEALVDTLTDANSYSATDLIPNATYYWRIDEVNDTDATSPWIGEVLSFSVPDLAAKNPAPADGTKFQPLTLDLRWTPGLGSTSHVVYIGNTFNEVENATSGGVTVTDPNYAPPDLRADKVYFWRVDEVNSQTYKGTVWKFSTVPVADGDVINPDLFAWWKMDEGEGRIVVDYSGHGHHAEFAENPKWDDGIFSGAVRVYEDGAGIGYVDLPDMPDFDSPEITVTGWIYQETMIPAWNQFFGTTSGTGSAGIMQVNGNMRVNYPQGNYTWNHGWDIDSGLALPVGEWAFIALSVDPTGASYYVNNASFRREANYVPFTVLAEKNYLGRDNKKGPAATLPGLVDDWRIYTKALTVAEIVEVMRGEPWLAWGPQPGNGTQTDALRASTLSWKAGDGATAHDVYLATDPDALQNADTTDTTGLYLGRNDLAVTTVTIADVNILST